MSAPKIHTVREGSEFVWILWTSKGPILRGLIKWPTRTSARTAARRYLLTGSEDHKPEPEPEDSL